MGEGLSSDGVDEGNVDGGLEDSVGVEVNDSGFVFDAVDDVSDEE